ncbi:MAG: DUF5119 domain-containing protein [Bacteroidaceae bacterium]|nr:DUF5119 domain-containing protein [Bacteroidaceae bacterium]
MKGMGIVGLMGLIGLMGPMGLIGLLLGSCDRRPLEVYYMDQARIVLHVDWMSQFGYHPNAMTVHLYDDTGRLCRSFSTNDVDSVPLSLSVGRYRMIVFNGDLDIFTSFGFEDVADFDLFRTVARENTRYRVRLWDRASRYTWEPDEVLGCAVDSFEVTEDMLDRQLKFVSYHQRNDAHGQTAIYRLDEVVHPLQTMIHVRVHVNGLQNMYGLEASLDGMADGCSMAQTWRNTTDCSVLYQKWGFYFDSDVSPHGWVDLDIATWGEPHGKELPEWRDSTDNVLRMNFTLRNDTTLYFEFNVGHLIEYRDPQRDPARLTPPDVLRHLYLEINREIPLLPDVLPDPDKETGAGFDAYVDPWDYGGEVDLGTF